MTPDQVLGFLESNRYVVTDEFYRSIDPTLLRTQLEALERLSQSARAQEMLADKPAFTACTCLLDVHPGIECNEAGCACHRPNPASVELAKIQPRFNFPPPTRPKE